MVVNGWTLYMYPLFEEQLTDLRNAVRSKPDPHHPTAKILAVIDRLTREIIPAGPESPAYRQGKTLGRDNQHWFRAKFLQRYRMFFRFGSKEKVIIYAWVNDESSLRKAGSKTDPYAQFKQMLRTGQPPSSLAELIAASSPLK